MNWIEAEAVCKRENSHLLSIETHEELMKLLLTQAKDDSSLQYKIISNLFNRLGFFFIGLNMRSVRLHSHIYSHISIKGLFIIH